MGRKKSSKIGEVKNEVPGSWRDVMQQFLWWKQAQNLSEETLSDYRRHISLFFKRYPDAFRSPEFKKFVLSTWPRS